jgi:hypothetical protein
MKLALLILGVIYLVIGQAESEDVITDYVIFNTTNTPPTLKPTITAEPITNASTTSAPITTGSSTDKPITLSSETTREIDTTQEASTEISSTDDSTTDDTTASDDPEPSTTPTPKKVHDFNTGSFIGGIIIGLSASLLVCAIVHCIKHRNDEDEDYQRLDTEEHAD